MKKLFLIVAAITLLATAGHSQEIFAKRDFVGHAGFGIGTYLSGTGFKVSIPPIVLSGDYGVADNLIAGSNGSIGIGPYIAFMSTKSDFTSYSVKSTFYVIGARGTFHYQFTNDLDTYVGLMFAYKGVSHQFPAGQTYSGSSPGLLPGGFIGARYYFAPNIAAFAELGYGIAALELGVAFRF
jgi:hypothetical protein